MTPEECCDRAEIHDVVIRYGWAIDTKDWALLDTCFTDDAEAEAFAHRWRRAFPRVPLTCIGRFVPKGRLPGRALDLRAYHGYEHLQARA